MKDQCYYRVSIKGIVTDKDGRILLCRESNGKWDMLGGGLDHEEDIFDCLRREVMEETGLKIVSISPTAKYFVTAQAYGYETFTANPVYEIELESLDFKPSDECQELRFMSTADMHEHHADLYPNLQKLLEVLENQ